MKWAEQTWDYIIIGTGMGGGPVGLKLAEAGFSVLFLEKGESSFESTSLKGQFAELFSHNEKNRNEVLSRAGRSTDVIYDCTSIKRKKLEPFIGSGVGGSTGLYGAILERFKPSDFREWPISYEELEKYYSDAEKLFRVQARKNFAHPSNQKLSDYLKDQNLNPYCLPLANEDKKDCGSCQGFLCAQRCKNDSGKICIETAIQNHGAVLLTRCEVQKIEIVNARASGVQVVYQGQNLNLKAHVVLLAAGALRSPLILQNSGISNPQMGRNLMRHYVDLYALKIDSDPSNPRAKELAFDDFYEIDGQKFGSVQSFGRLPPADVIVEEMQRELDSQSRALAVLFKVVKPFFKLILRRVISNRIVIASLLEDSPRSENRVWSENEKICIAYEISENDQKKIVGIRKKLKKLFKPFSLLFIPRSEKNEMLAHVCGTCRMGTDPQLSVVDVENKVHGTENLYVVDASFFPTGGGTNPALTIAANSLRVAEILIAREKSKKQPPVQFQGQAL